MNFIDLFLVIFLIVTAIKGYTRGFIIEIFSILAFIVGLFLAIELTAPVAIRFFSGSDYFELISILIFIAIFVGLSVAINLLAKVLKKIIDISMLGMFDNVLGALLGMFKFALIASILIWMFDSIGFDLPNRQADSSRILPYIIPLGPKVFELIGALLPFFKDVFDTVDKFDRKGKITDVFLQSNYYFT